MWSLTLRSPPPLATVTDPTAESFFSLSAVTDPKKETLVLHLCDPILVLRSMGPKGKHSNLIPFLVSQALFP